MQTFSSKSGIGSRDCSPNERIAPAFPGIATAGGRGRRARAARRDAAAPAPRPLGDRIPLWAGAAREGIEEGARPVYRQQQQASRTLR